MSPVFVHNANNALGAVSRRHFLAGGGLLLAFAQAPRVHAEAASSALSDSLKPDSPTTLGGLVKIGTDNQISLIVPNIEMGQGIYTTEAMMIAEELEVALEAITVLTALPQEVSDISPAFLKSLYTGGSKSVRKGWIPLRQAGASARLMLLAAAAEKWNLPQQSLYAENGIISDVSGRYHAPYGDFALDAARQHVPEHIPLKPPTEWKIIGHSCPRVDIPAKVTGKAIFGIDVRVPGMVFAAVMGPPVFGASVDSLDTDITKAIPGVLDVLHNDGMIAVVAKNYWTARKGLDALKIKWNLGPNATLSSEDIRNIIRDAAHFIPAVVARDDAGTDAALKSGKNIEQAYQLPFLAHAPMEPANTTLHVRADGCDVWMGTQVPTRARKAVAKITGLPEEKIAIHNYMIGGSFGRRLATDFLEQATKFACKISAPVKFIWSREEDIRQDLFRPAYYDRMRASLDADGLPLAWCHHVSGPSVVDRFAPGGLPAGKLDSDAVEGAVQTPYELPLMRVIWTRVQTPVPVSWWRGVGPAHNVYVVESFMDELAAEAQTDPIEYRLRLLQKNPRSVAVLKRVRQESQWGTALPARTGRGVALHNAFGTHCAVVVEVAVPQGGPIMIKRVTAVVDCGIAINQDALIAQMEGGLLFGFTAALYGEITIKNGQVEQTNFHNHRLMRINETPLIDVHIINSGEEPGGIGEVGTTSAFPALGNALYNATGKRYRSYPFNQIDL